MLARYDTNGDGVLDDSERAKMRADMAARRAAHEANGGGGGAGRNQAGGSGGAPSSN
jgi:hypothetical protein